MENSFCRKCGECCKNIAVDFEQEILYRDGVQNLTAEFAKLLQPVSKTKNITFCSCKFLMNNICTNPDKPQDCINFPSSPFAFLPDDCGFEGEIFLKSEHVKQKIRKKKEEIMYYSSSAQSDKQVQRIIHHLQAHVDRYKVYGSDNW